jgi:site-specific DNA-adenine methylase
MKKKTKRIQNKDVKVILPKLKKIDNSKKKFHYKLADPFNERKKAIHDGIRLEIENGKSYKKAIIAKKRRFNVLRIYRKNSRNTQKKRECKTITEDMKYMNKLLYGRDWKGKTKNICKD